MATHPVDMDPVEEVYRTDHARLWRSLVGFSGDADIAAEAEAEAYSQAIARGDHLDDPRAWIWRAAFRIAAGLLADRGRQVPPPGETPQLDTPLVEFLSLLGELSEQQRAAVVLRYAGGLRPAEIAEVLDTSAGTIRVQLHRAHAQLRERMER
ncbi:MAG: RNA polymerase sigma factor [Actinomycetota bacterium]